MLQLHAAIMDHPDAWPFLEAVDGREVTDYYEIIKDPVDLAMLKRRLVSPASPKLSGRCRCRRAEEASWGESSHLFSRLPCERLSSQRTLGRCRT